MYTGGLPLMEFSLTKCDRQISALASGATFENEAFQFKAKLSNSL